MKRVRTMSLRSAAFPTVNGAVGFLLAAAALVALAALTFVPQASAVSYHSPGYKGTKRFGKVVQAPLPPITIGTGKYPNLLVDGAGTAHILFAQDGGTTAPDTLAFCNLQRGIKSCASAGTAPNPQAPEPSDGGEFSGNLPYLNHDFDGPVPLAIGNQLFVIDRRFPEIFKTPNAAVSDSNVFEWSSVDGGATITGPGQIGDNQMAGGAIAYGDPGAPSVGTISATETGGTFFQGSQSGQYTTAKAQLGTGDQAYYGSLALDGTRPVAAFADLSGNVFVREWSGQGNANDASTWSSSSFAGDQPQIVGGASGVFVLYSDSNINGGNLQLRRIAGGQPVGAPVALGKSATQPAISEDPTGRIALAYTDQLGVEVRTSNNGAEFSPAALTAAAPNGQGIVHLASAATTDGGGFIAYVQNPVSTEGVGSVQLAAFGTQRATEKPGLGPLPGGGIGSAVGDQLATSTCLTAGFGVVAAENVGGGCWGHEAKNPNLDVSLGEVDINGLRIIPDAGVRIGIDPKLHTIDTTGKVRVVLSGGGINITLFHDELHAKIPTGAVGEELFDLHEKQPPLVEGFPIEGDIDIKLVKGGVQVPISLKLPAYFGGVTGSATLEATISGKLKLNSVEFKVGDANFGALELKDVDVSYTLEGEVWKGEGEVQVPAGGGAVDAKVSVEFDKGKFVKGSLDVGLPYPGIPLDDTDPPPQLYMSHGGLELGLDPVKLGGTIGFGAVPLKPPGDGERRDYAFSLDGELSVTFGKPVTFTAEAQGFLYTMEIANAKLVYKIPDQVSLDAEAKFDLGLIKFKGSLSAIIDPEHDIYAARLKSAIIFHLPNPFSDLEMPGLTVEINNKGFAIYVPPPGFTIPAPPFLLFGTISYHWGDTLPKVFLYQDKTGKEIPVNPLIKHEPGTVSRVHTRATAIGFTVPAHAPTASLVVHGSGGAPSVVLVAPNGRRLDLAAKPNPSAAMTAGAMQDPTSRATYVGIQHPAAGNWRVEQAPRSKTPIARAEASVSVPGPKISAKLGGHGLRRTVHYRTSATAGLAIAIAEQTGSSLRVIGHAHAGSGTIRFRPAFGPAGRRSVVAMITHEGLPAGSEQLGTFVAPRPPRPGRAKKLRVKAGKRALSFSFTPPANSAHTLLRIVATDGRHLQQIAPHRTRRGSVPVIGFHDGITVAVVGLGEDGSRGPAVKASARQPLPKQRKAKPKAKKRRGHR